MAQKQTRQQPTVERYLVPITLESLNRLVRISHPKNPTVGHLFPEPPIREINHLGFFNESIQRLHKCLVLEILADIVIAVRRTRKFDHECVRNTMLPRSG